MAIKSRIPLKNRRLDGVLKDNFSEVHTSALLKIEKKSIIPAVADQILAKRSLINPRRMISTVNMKIAREAIIPSM